MHLILTGATGLIGSSVLDAMLKMTEVTKISILSRRPVAMAENAKDPRVNVIIHKDFSNYDSEVLTKLQGASGAVWALGVSQTKVSKEYVHRTWFIRDKNMKKLTSCVTKGVHKNHKGLPSCWRRSILKACTQ